MDVGLARLARIAATDGTRTDVENPKHLGRKQRKLVRLEREKSRRQKGSNNRDKTRRKVAIAHAQVARARRDYHHKQALALVRENQVIHVEDLNIVGMVKNRRLARAISDAVGAVRADNPRESRPLRAHPTHGVAVAGIEQDVLGVWVPARRAAIADTRVVVPDLLDASHDRDHNAAKIILAAGRAESLNACGDHVRPQPVAALDDETRSSPTAA